MPNIKPVIALGYATLFLMGCTAIAPTNVSEDEAASSAEGAGSVATVAATEPPPAPEPVEESIPKASLYPLLAAEFALREQAFETALEIFSEQAMLLDDPEVARRGLKLAEFRGRDDVALKLAQRLSELDADDAAAAATAMGLLVRAGQPEKALEFARKAKERGARINAPALLVEFEELPVERRNQVQAAVEALHRDWPLDTDIAIATALVRRETGDLKGGLKALEPVLEEQPADERALVLWTQIKLDIEAEDAFDRIARALEAPEESETLRLQYARLLASEEDIDGAREQFQILQTLSPRNGDYLFSLALIELEVENPEAATANLQALLDLGQRVDEAHYYLGRIAEDAGATSEAVRAYTKVGPSREFLDAIRRAGRLKLSSGDIEGFSRLFTNARRNSPGQAERLFVLQADLLRGTGSIIAAIDVYTDALSVFNESMPLQYGRAMTYESAGDIALMEADLRAILAREPDNATTLNALGYTLTVHTTRYAEAAELISQALKLSPGDPAILDSLGWVYFKMGRYEEALGALKEAYQKFPDPEVAAHLGETLWAMGRTDEAIQLWQAVLNEDPQNTLITEAIARLGVTMPEGTVN